MSQAPIKLIVGLGNPGDQYTDTRHNAGAWFVEDLARFHNANLKPEKKFKGEAARINIDGEECYLLLPTTFMNLSGESVGALAKFYKIPAESILVAHDELDIPAGSVRLKTGGGHGGHNGLRSIIQHLGTKDFARLRIGIGHPGDSRLVSDYVLKRPSKSDKQQIENAISDVDHVLSDVMAGKFQIAMNRLHTD